MGVPTSQSTEAGLNSHLTCSPSKSKRPVFHQWEQYCRISSFLSFNQAVLFLSFCFFFFYVSFTSQTLPVSAVVRLFLLLPTAAWCSSFFEKNFFASPFSTLSASRTTLAPSRFSYSVRKSHQWRQIITHNMTICPAVAASGQASGMAITTNTGPAASSSASSSSSSTFISSSSRSNLTKCCPSLDRTALSPLLIDLLTLAHWNEGALRQCFNKNVFKKKINEKAAKGTACDTPRGLPLICKTHTHTHTDNWDVAGGGGDWVNKQHEGVNPV